MVIEESEAETSGGDRGVDLRKHRPGGRTARVRAAVLRAVQDLLDGEEPVTIARVAQLADVTPSALYQRWGSADAILLDLALQTLGEVAPIKATGDLQGDLEDYMIELTDLMQRSWIASNLSKFFAAVASGQKPVMMQLVNNRFTELDATFAAAGYKDPDKWIILNHLLAPAYFRTQIEQPFRDHDEVRELVRQTIRCLDD